MQTLRSIFLIAALAVPCAALATPITYNFTATGTGTLGGTAFTDSTITFTEVADTNNITFRSDFGAYLNVGSVNVSVSGVGGTTLDSSFSFVSVANYGMYGVFKSDGSSGALLVSPSLGGYDLSTALFPTSNNSFYYGGALTGTAGSLGFSSLTDGVASASTDPVAVTPEPSSLMLFGSGMLAVIAVASRRSHA